MGGDQPQKPTEVGPGAGARREDVPEGQRPRGQPRLLRGRPHLLAEPQRSVRTTEVVPAPDELHLVGESLLAPGVREGPAMEVRAGLTDGEVESLDERGIQLLGVLGSDQGFRQPLGGPDPKLSPYLRYPILPPGLDHLPVDAGDSEKPRDHPEVVPKPSEVTSSGSVSGFPEELSRELRAITSAISLSVLS